jgi:glycosyltransferase involved in cell wall biosynthesis
MARDPVTGQLDLLHVHSGNIFGGVERTLQTLAGVTTPVSSRFALCFDGDTAAALRREGGRVDWLGPVHIRRPDQVLGARGRLRALLEQSTPDVVVVHSSWSQAIFGGTAAACGAPLVRWLHAPEPGPALLERWAWRTRPRMVLCNSDYTRTAAARLVGDLPTAVCYPPARSAGAPSERAAVRRRLGSTTTTCVILLAARPEPWKGHRRLLAALSTIAALDWEAWIAGGAQRRQEQAFLDGLRDRARTAGLAGRVRFLGQRDDLPDLLAAADIYCQPNEGPEPFGLSVVEAMAAGLPIVASSAGATPEIVDRDSGILVPLADDDALAGALSRLVGDRDLRRAMGEAARRSARRFTDLPESMAALASCLSNVIGTATPSRT